MAYGLAFQRCLVPDVEDTQVLRIERELSGFRLQLGDGSSYAMAHRVILAVDITHFQVLPTAPTHLLAELLTHSSAHTDVERIRERDVTVMGAGASAIDLAVLPDGGRGQRRPGRSAYDSTVRRSVESSAASVPSSTIGPGWRSFVYANAPWLFYRLPTAARWHIVKTSLAPAAGWP